MLGKPLCIFISRPEQASFDNPLSELRVLALERVEAWEVWLQPYKSSPIVVNLKVATMHDNKNNLIGLRWLLYEGPLSQAD